MRVQATAVLPCSLHYMYICARMNQALPATGKNRWNIKIKINGDSPYGGKNRTPNTKYVGISVPLNNRTSFSLLSPNSRQRRRFCRPTICDAPHSVPTITNSIGITIEESNLSEFSWQNNVHFSPVSFSHLLKASVMVLALRMSDCNSASFSFICRAYDSDPGLGGLHIIPIASWPVTLGDRLMEHNL